MTKRFERLGLCLAALTAATIGYATARADEPQKKDGPNAAKAEEGKKGEPDKTAEQAARIKLAHDLIAFGRTEGQQSPEALVLAAKILGTTPMKTAQDDKFSIEKGEQLKELDLDPAKLIAEAKEMTDDEGLAAYADMVASQISERPRGEIDGPATLCGYVGPNAESVWNGVFVGGQFASVTAAGTGADLDLYIYDDRGILIDQDTSPDHNPTCSWQPIYTGKFTMRVVNCSPYPSQYRLIHN